MLAGLLAAGAPEEPPGGVPLDRAGVTVAAGPDGERNPAVAPDGAGRLPCVYERQGADGTSAVAARVRTTR